MLEVGAGRGVTGAILRHLGFAYSTLSDLPSQMTREQTLLHDATEVGVAGVVCAFQVLEHNPRAELGRLLEALTRLTSGYVAISLPVSLPYLRLTLEPKLWSGYAIASVSAYSWTLRLPRALFPRPSGKLRKLLGTTTIRPMADDGQDGYFNSPDHQWEVGDRGSTTDEIVEEAAAVGLSLVAMSYAPYFPRQVFLDFRKD
ncbi:MAG: hypothetical protein ACKORC_04630 [Acidimicrobiia bacterium]